MNLKFEVKFKNDETQKKDEKKFEFIDTQGNPQVVTEDELTYVGRLIGNIDVQKFQEIS